MFVNVTIIKFLRFLFNESNLMGWIENEVNGSLLIHIALYTNAYTQWCRVYD